MTARRPGLVVVTALSAPLAVATSASAECAWVLWKQDRDFRTHVTGEWTPSDAFQKKEECRASIEASKESAKQLKALQIAGDRIYQMDSAGRSVSMTERNCLPDTVDPRGPKGK